MKILKRIIFVIFCVVDLLLLVVCINYLSEGLKTPTLLGNREIHSIGAYLVAAAYFLVFLILTIVLILIFIKHKKKEN